MDAVQRSRQSASPQRFLCCKPICSRSLQPDLRLSVQLWHVGCVLHSVHNEEFLTNEQRELKPMSHNASTTSKPVNIALWIIQILLAIMFVMAGLAKVTGDATMVENFEKIGLGQWFRVLTGVVEMASALLLVVPKLNWAGAGLLVATMIGASVAHFTVLGGSAVPAMVFGVLAGIVLVGRGRSWIVFNVSDESALSERTADAT